MGLQRGTRPGRPILCGVDLALGRERAAAWSAALARELESEAVLLHAEPVPGEHRALQRLHGLIDRHGFPHGAQALVAAGDPAEELLRLAEEIDAELIVVAGRGLRELGSALLGGVSAALGRTAPCPVAVLPPVASIPSLGIRSIVAGVAGDGRDRELLRFAADLAARLDASLVPVHAFDSRPVVPGGAGVAPPIVPELRGAAEARLEEALATAGLEVRGRVVGLSPAAGLQRVAEEHGAGLIVVASHGRGRLGSVLRGSVTIQLGAEAAIPVVVLPPTAELGAGSGHYEVASDAA